MTSQQEIQHQIDTAITSLDEDALDALLQSLYEPAEEAPAPFDAAIQLKPEYRDVEGIADTESQAAMRWANQIARAKRRVVYLRKIRGGFDGLRIVEEGDSWFQYPLLLDDAIDHLIRDEDKAILSLSGAGDLVSDMASRREHLAALEESGARIMLLSGGGNDLLGGGRLANVLLPYAPGADPADLINTPLFELELRKVVDHYRTILTEVGQHFPGVQIFGHAYDLPIPQEGGKWLGTPLTDRGIPLDVGRKVIKQILGAFTEALERLVVEAGNFTFVNLFGKVGRGGNSWHDELHPRNAGYGRAAAEFRQAIADFADAGGLEAGPARGAAPAVEAARTGTIVLDPGHGGSPPPSKTGGSSWNNAIGPNGTLEKTLTFDVAKRAKALLEGRGHRVALTRDTDTNLGLRDRAAVAKAVAAPVFVSIHFNASNAHNAQGTETWVHTRHSEASQRLAQAVQANMVAALGLRDRGVKTAGFGVLNPDSHAATTAAALHEVSFLDRQDEEARLLTVAYRDRIATALADGIESFLGLGGVESAPGLMVEELGDAVEFSAERSGQTVPVFLGLAEGRPAAAAPQPLPPMPTAHVGGHAIVEAAVSDGGFSARLAQGHRRLIEGASVPLFGDGEDRNEFATVDIGPGLILSGAPGLESDVGAITSAFENVPGAGFDLERFEAFIGGLGLEFFVPAEFLYMGASNEPGRSCAGLNGLPPEHLWPNIANTALMLDEIRRRLRAPVRINSCYRNDAYNRCVGGASGSLHKQFNAIDWRCDAGNSPLWHQVAVEVRASRSQFIGGVGKYNTFVHVDTRGQQADW